MFLCCCFFFRNERKGPKKKKLQKKQYWMFGCVCGRSRHGQCGRGKSWKRLLHGKYAALAAPQERSVTSSRRRRRRRHDLAQRARAANLRRGHRTHLSVRGQETHTHARGQIPLHATAKHKTLSVLDLEAPPPPLSLPTRLGRAGKRLQSTRFEIAGSRDATRAMSFKEIKLNKSVSFDNVKNKAVLDSVTPRRRQHRKIVRKK